MGIRLKKVVLWGRSLEEYEAMFNLSNDDLKKRVIGVADGPASANNELQHRAPHYQSVDPIYAETPDTLRGMFEDSFDEVFGLVEQSLADNAMDWREDKSSDEIKAERRYIFDQFLADYSQRRGSSAYVAGGLPNLPFEDRQFDLALSSYLLFAYSGILSTEFHCNAVREMRRIADEVRLFPLTNADEEYSEHLQPVMDEALADGWTAERVPVSYKLVFSNDKTEMLLLKRQ